MLETSTERPDLDQPTGAADQARARGRTEQVHVQFEGDRDVRPDDDHRQEPGQDVGPQGQDGHAQVLGPRDAHLGGHRSEAHQFVPVTAHLPPEFVRHVSGMFTEPSPIETVITPLLGSQGSRRPAGPARTLGAWLDRGTKAAVQDSTPDGSDRGRVARCRVERCRVQRRRLDPRGGA